MGAGRKANTRGLVRAPSGLLERLQCRVALEALSESGGSFGPEEVVVQTASMGAEVGAKACQGALTERRTLSGGGALEVGDHRLLEDGSERGGALVSDEVAFDTARDGCRGQSKMAGACQRTLTERRTLRANSSATWLTGALAALSCP